MTCIDPQERLSQLLIEFYEKLSSWEHEVVKESGLSTAQMHAVEIIGHHGNLRMKEVAEKMGITTGSLTVMVDRMELNGLVERQAHPQDRRSYVMALTRKGERLRAQHHQLHLGLTREITATLGDDEISLLNQLMAKIQEQF